MNHPPSGREPPQRHKEEKYSMGRKKGGFKLKPIYIITILLIAAWYMGYLNPLIDAFTGGAGAGIIVTPETFVGTVTLKVNEVNKYGDAAETLTSSSFAAYGAAGGPGVGGVSISASGTDFEVENDDDGLIYMKVYQGTAHYTVTDELLSRNDRVEDLWWEDLDADGLDDLLIKVNLNGLQSGTIGVKPAWTLILPVIDEDVTTPADDNPADQTAIGTTEVVVQVTWDVSGVSEKAGFVVSNLYFTTSNGTRQGVDVKFEECTIVGPTVSVSIPSPVKIQDGGTAGDLTVWYIHNLDNNDYAKGIMHMRPDNTADKLSITVNIRCTFEDGDAETLQLELEYVQAEGTTATLQDAVYLNENA